MKHIIWKWILKNWSVKSFNRLIFILNIFKNKDDIHVLCNGNIHVFKWNMTADCISHDLAIAYGHGRWNYI